MKKFYFLPIVLFALFSRCKSCEEALKEEIGKSEIKGVVSAKYLIEFKHNLPILEVRSENHTRRLVLYECYGDNLWHYANVGDSVFKAYNSYKVILVHGNVRQDIDLKSFTFYHN